MVNWEAIAKSGIFSAETIAIASNAEKKIESDPPGVYTFKDVRQRAPRIFDRDNQPNENLDKFDKVYFDTHRYSDRNLSVRLTETQRVDRLLDICSRMYGAVYSPDARHHFTNLDEVFSSLLECQWCYRWSDQTKITEYDPPNGTNLVQTALQYLERIPICAISLPSDLSMLPDDYFRGDQKTWESLRILSRLPSNTLRLMFYYLITKDQKRGGWVDTIVQSILNCVGEFITITVRRAKHQASPEIRHRWLLVRAYLWNFWYSSRNFYAFCIFDRDIAGGARHSGTAQWMQNFQLSESATVANFTETLANQNRPSNLCPWVLQLLKSDPMSLALNFPLLYKNYTHAMSHVPIRCSPNANQLCDGQHANNCLRYRGLKVSDQSMHDLNCTTGSTSETKLVWDQASYCAVSGPRAVDLSHKKSGQLSFCTANDQTMAISHVWSHGQGGRPESGINTCLHQRYTALAQSLGCASYWMDTTCIPTDHNLRAEAIENINQVFYTSKVVLVCDKDLMTIDLSNASTKDYESAACAILMCDWNTRAWTVLEGLKGRQCIHFLFVGNQVVRLTDIMQKIVANGSLEVCGFMNLMPHIMPSNSHDRSFKKIELEMEWDKLTVEETGSWLSHRPASRPGDDLIIWSLLPSNRNKPISSAADFWRSQTLVHTGFLISSAERLTEPGLSWAPKTSYAVPKALSNGFMPPYHRPLASEETQTARISAHGLECDWMMHEFHDHVSRGQLSPTESELHKIYENLVQSGHKAGLFHPVKHDYQLEQDISDVPSNNRDTILFAVCSTDQTTVRHCQLLSIWPQGGKSYEWIWRGVVEWPRGIPLPGFHLQSYVWIA